MQTPGSAKVVPFNRPSQKAFDDRLTGEPSQENEKYFRTLIENSLDLVTVLNADGTIRYESPSIERVTGYTSEERTGMSIFDLTHPDDIPHVADVFNRAIHNPGMPESIQVRFRHKDGSWHVIESVGKNLLDDPAVRGIIINSRDVTDRRSAEKALKESEGRYRTLMDTSPDAITVSDTNGTIIMANTQAAVLHGYAAQEDIIGKNMVDLVSPEERASCMEKLKTICAKGAFKCDNFILARKDGTLFPAEIHASCIYDQDGKPIGIIRMSKDISERKRAEEALRRREKLFRTLIENSKDIITMCDAEGKIIFESPSVEQIFGIPAEKRIGMSIFDFMHRDDIGIRSEKFFEAVRTHTDFPDFEVRYPRTDGTWRVLEGVGRNLLDDPEINAFVINSRDITERKRLEEMFLQAQKMETVGKLAGGIAHDLNNILTVITSYGGFVKDALTSSDPIHEDIGEVLKASTRATNLVRQLLAFSRRQVIKPQTMNLNNLILDMDKMLRRLIGENIKLVTLPGPDLGPVKVDPGQIEQVIANLVVNARDAMPDGGTLTIETAAATLDEDFVSHHLGASQGRHVMLAVSDTGIGMSDEVKKHLFEPFFTTKDVGKGSGLGLATVYGIIRQHKGTIWVYSEKGKGTTFKIYLPQVGESVGHPTIEDQIPRLPGGNDTILVVEDEEPVRKAAVRILHGLGYTVLEAANGEEALTLVKNCLQNIHLLLTDVVMPQMNGKDLADRLKAVHPRLKILFMSGYTNNTIVGRSDFVEGVMYIHKPFSSAILAHKIREVLRSAPGLGDASGQKESA